MRIDSDLGKALRGPMVAAALMLAAAGGLATDAWLLIDGAEARERAREAAVSDMQREGRTLRAERADAAADGERFAALKTAGAFDLDARAQLVDGFEAAVRPWQPQIASMTLGAFDDAALPGASGPSQYTVRAASVVVDLLPRHELSFLAITQALAAAAPGPHALERCELGWAEPERATSLKARCTLRIFRFERRVAPSPVATAAATPSFLPAPSAPAAFVPTGAPR